MYVLWIVKVSLRLGPSLGPPGLVSELLDLSVEHDFAGHPLEVRLLDWNAGWLQSSQDSRTAGHSCRGVSASEILGSYKHSWLAQCPGLVKLLLLQDFDCHAFSCQAVPEKASEKWTNLEIRGNNRVRYSCINAIFETSNCWILQSGWRVPHLAALLAWLPACQALPWQTHLDLQLHANKLETALGAPSPFGTSRKAVTLTRADICPSRHCDSFYSILLACGSPHGGLHTRC